MLLVPKHAGVNFKRLKPFLEIVSREPRRYVSIENEPYMPLNIESLECSDPCGRPVFAMSHVYVQNGDLMRDPDMTFSVDFAGGRVFPLSYQQDALGAYSEVTVLEDGDVLATDKLLFAELDSFLWYWIRAILDQGYLEAYAAAAESSNASVANA